RGTSGRMRATQTRARELRRALPILARHPGLDVGPGLRLRCRADRTRLYRSAVRRRRRAARNECAERLRRLAIALPRSAPGDALRLAVDVRDDHLAFAA